MGHGQSSAAKPAAERGVFRAACRSTRWPPLVSEGTNSLLRVCCQYQLSRTFIAVTWGCRKRETKLHSNCLWLLLCRAHHSHLELHVRARSHGLSSSGSYAVKCSAHIPCRAVKKSSSGSLVLCSLGSCRVSNTVTSGLRHAEHPSCAAVQLLGNQPPPQACLQVLSP